jgi:alpha-maltose-1-phosphate synthase
MEHERHERHRLHCLDRKDQGAMNVLMLSREYPPHIYGGAGVVVDELSRALARLARVEVRCFGDQRAAGPPLGVQGYAPTAEIGRAAAAFRHRPVLEALAVDLAMASDPVEADVVHSHTWYAAFGGVLVRALFDIPLVVTLHSLEPLRPWKEDQLGTGYRVSTWLERLAVEQAERVIAVSEQMRADILTHFAVPAERVVVIHNGVDAQSFRRTERHDALARLGVTPPYVLFVGRISEQKGIFHLLEASRRLPAGVQLVLCAAAPDTPELERRLTAEVAGRPSVRWINAMVPRDQVVQLYSHAACFVCPSVYEPFGIINLEAMACGTPVVASAVGGIPEVVVDGETGFLVAPGDPKALAVALDRVLADPGRGATMGRAGRRRVEERFAWERIAERTLVAYEDARRAHREGSSAT